MADYVTRDSQGREYHSSDPNWRPGETVNPFTGKRTEKPIDAKDAPKWKPGGQNVNPITNQPTDAPIEGVNNPKLQTNTRAESRQLFIDSQWRANNEAKIKQEAQEKQQAQKLLNNLKTYGQLDITKNAQTGAVSYAVPQNAAPQTLFRGYSTQADPQWLGGRPIASAVGGGEIYRIPQRQRQPTYEYIPYENGSQNGPNIPIGRNIGNNNFDIAVQAFREDVQKENNISREFEKRVGFGKAAEERGIIGASAQKYAAGFLGILPTKDRPFGSIGSQAKLVTEAAFIFGRGLKENPSQAFSQLAINSAPILLSPKKTLLGETTADAIANSAMLVTPIFAKGLTLRGTGEVTVKGRTIEPAKVFDTLANPKDAPTPAGRGGVQVITTTEPVAGVGGKLGLKINTFTTITKEGTITQTQKVGPKTTISVQTPSMKAPVTDVYYGRIHWDTIGGKSLKGYNNPTVPISVVSAKGSASESLQVNPYKVAQFATSKGIESGSTGKGYVFSTIAERNIRVLQQTTNAQAKGFETFVSKDFPVNAQPKVTRLGQRAQTFEKTTRPTIEVGDENTPHPVRSLQTFNKQEPFSIFSPDKSTTRVVRNQLTGELTTAGVKSQVRILDSSVSTLKTQSKPTLFSKYTEWKEGWANEFKRDAAQKESARKNAYTQYLKELDTKSKNANNAFQAESAKKQAYIKQTNAFINSQYGRGSLVLKIARDGTYTEQLNVPQTTKVTVQKISPPTSEVRAVSRQTLSAAVDQATAERAAKTSSFKPISSFSGLKLQNELRLSTRTQNVLTSTYVQNVRTNLITQPRLISQLRNEQVQRSETRRITSQIQTLTPKLFIGQVVNPITKVALETTPVQVVITRTSSTYRPSPDIKNPITTVKTPPPTVITGPPLFSSDKKIKRKSKGFNVFERRRGVFRQINQQALNEAQAIDFGANRVRKTLGATFKLEPTGSWVDDTGKTDITTPSGFKKLADKYIQLAKYRLSSVQEKQEIKQAKKNKAMIWR